VARYEINTPAINLAVRGTGFRVQVDSANGLTRTEVGEGLVAGSAGNENALIGRGFGLIAEPGKPLGQPQGLLPAPRLLPTPNTLSKLPVSFAWQALEGASQYRLQLLVRLDGNEAIIADELMESTRVEWDDLPDGEYVLRVRGVHPNRLEGQNAVKSFTLSTRPEPPRLALPQDGHNSSQNKTLFRWDAAPEAHRYQIQIAEDALFEQLVALVPGVTGDARAVLLPLAKGRYFWRVASVTAAGKLGPYSEPFQLVVGTAGPNN
jgi:hypothetical protein